MRFSLKDLIEGHKSIIDIEVEEKIDRLNCYGDEIKVVTPTVLKGSIFTLNREFFIQGTLEATVELICSRCLKKIQQEIIGKIDAQLVNVETPDIPSDEYYLIHNGSIDVNEIMENALILALPIKALCDEDCKGLCLTCGKDLNVIECDCTTDSIDPRFAKLKDLLQQD